MGDRSGIEWTDATWNPVTGCTKVSPGCEHCYAERITHRFGGDFATVTPRPDRLETPLRWRRPRRVFVNSMSDLFHPDVPEAFIGSVWNTMALADQHMFQILTKRPARARALLTRWAADNWTWRRADMRWCGPISGPLPNVWIGVSAETQKWADIRVPELLRIPAAVRFVSAEPLLGPVDLREYLAEHEVVGWNADLYKNDDRPALHWVIAGGESGSGARPMHPDWARSLRDQCAAAGTAFFFKQWGEWGPAPWVVRVYDHAEGWSGTPEQLDEAKAEAERTGATHALMPSGHLYAPPHNPWSLERRGHQPGAIRRYGRRRAGRVLDGRTWDQYPEVSTA